MRHFRRDVTVRTRIATISDVHNDTTLIFSTLKLMQMPLESKKNGRNNINFVKIVEPKCNNDAILNPTNLPQVADSRIRKSGFSLNEDSRIRKSGFGLNETVVIKQSGFEIRFQIRCNQTGPKLNVFKNIFDIVDKCKTKSYLK